MKKIIFFFACLFLVNTQFAATVVTKPSANAAQIFLKIGKHGEMVSLLDLSTMKVKQLESLTGKKMKFAERLAFKGAQHKLQNSISADGTLESKKLDKYFKRAGEGGGFNGGGFALGLILGVIGVLISYLINDDKKKNRVKWAWIGWGVWIVIVLILIASGVKFN